MLGAFKVRNRVDVPVRPCFLRIQAQRGEGEMLVIAVDFENASFQRKEPRFDGQSGQQVVDGTVKITESSNDEVFEIVQNLSSEPIVSEAKHSRGVEVEERDDRIARRGNRLGRNLLILVVEFNLADPRVIWFLRFWNRLELKGLFPRTFRQNSGYAQYLEHQPNGFLR